MRDFKSQHQQWLPTWGRNWAKVLPWEWLPLLYRLASSWKAVVDRKNLMAYSILVPLFNTIWTTAWPAYNQHLIKSNQESWRRWNSQQSTQALSSAISGACVSLAQYNSRFLQMMGEIQKKSSIRWGFWEQIQFRPEVQHTPLSALSIWAA